MAMQTFASGVPDWSTTTPSIRYAAPGTMSGVGVAGCSVGAIMSTLPEDPIAISRAAVGSGRRVLTAALVLAGEGSAALPQAPTSIIASEDATVIRIVRRLIEQTPSGASRPSL